MKTKNILLAGGALFLLYMLSRGRAQVGKRGYYTRQEIDNRPGCHQGEIANYIRRTV